MYGIREVYVFLSSSSESGLNKILFAFFLPIISGVIVAVVSSLIQKYNDKKRFEFEREQFYREQLFSSLFAFQKEVLEYVMLFLDIRELVGILKIADPFKSVDLSTMKGSEVREALQSMMNSTGLKSKKSQATGFVAKFYFEEIESKAKKAFSQDEFPHIFYEFSKIGIEPARLLGGKDLEDFNSLVSFCEKNSNNGFRDITYDELVNRVVETTKRCENRIKKQN